MIKEQIFLKIPLSFQEKIKIYPPTVYQVFSEKNFSLYLQLLTYSQEELEDELFGYDRDFSQDYSQISPLKWLIIYAAQSQQNYQNVQTAFEFFTKEKITIDFNNLEIFLGNLEESIKEAKEISEVYSKLVILNEKNFFIFQNLIRQSVGIKEVEKIPIDENPKVKKIKAKGRKRDKIKAKQEKIDFFTYLSSICCMGIGITPLNIGELSYASIQAIIARYQEKEKYELDIKQLLAGASSKDIKPKYWIRKLDEK